MSINYNESKLSFDKYVEECKKKIKETFFEEDYLSGLKALKNSLIQSGKIDKNSSIEYAVKYQRLDMIDIKINHTMRIVEDVMQMAEKIGTKVDFNNILKVSALLHDIGRFDQATWNNSFADSCYKSVNEEVLGKRINNHAHDGYRILFKNNKISEFPIDKKFYPAIGSVVYNHGNPTLMGDLNLKTNNINILNPNNLTGNENLNDVEKVIVSSLVQMVRDVDMLDILYQHLTGEFPVIRPDIQFDVLDESIEEIAKYWDIEPSELLQYNGITEKDLSKFNSIKIPVNEISLKKLIVPKDIQEKFYNNEHMDLQELKNRRDWTFIVGMWWRLNHFLRNITFTSNLQLVQEKELLEKIYNQYPEEYKFLVKDAFEFAKEKLINEVLDKNKSEMYIKK